MLLSFSEIIHFTIHKFVETLFKFTMIQQLEIDVSSITPQKGIIESWSLDRLHLAPLSGQTPSFLGSSDGRSNLLPLKKGTSWWILSSPPGDTDWVGHKNDDESGQHLPQLVNSGEFKLLTVTVDRIEFEQELCEFLRSWQHCRWPPVLSATLIFMYLP